MRARMKPVTPEESLAKPSQLPRLRDEAFIERFSQSIVPLAADWKCQIGTRKCSCRTLPRLYSSRQKHESPQRRTTSSDTSQRHRSILPDCN